VNSVAVGHHLLAKRLGTELILVSTATAVGAVNFLS